MNDRKGGCRCGAARFTTAGDPKFVARCHCAGCRRATGAEFATWVGWRDEQVTWTGVRAVYPTSPGVERGFCQSCGTPLSYKGEKWPGETHLLIGAFDDPAAFAPKGDAFVAEALPWNRKTDEPTA